ERNERNNVDTSFLTFADADELTMFTHLSRLLTAVDSIPELLRAHEQMGIISRMVQWDLCRAHLVVYEWLQHIGPQMARDLILLHQRSIADLERLFPKFARLVKQVFCYAKQVQDAAPRSKKRKPTNETPPVPAVPVDDAQKIPADLFGLIAKPTRTGAIKLPTIGKVAQKNGNLALVNAATDCLLDVLSREMVIIPMAQVDDRWLSPQRRAAKKKAKTSSTEPAASAAEEMKKVAARLMSRGALLRCLVTVCEGEYIFASAAMHEVLVGPTTLLPKKWHEDIRFAAALVREEEVALKALMDVLQSKIGDDTDVPVNAAKPGAFVHRRTLELHRGRPIEEEEFRNPHSQASAGVSLAAPAPKETRRKHIPHASLTVSQLLVNDVPPGSVSVPLFAKLALIVREALNERHGRAPSNQSLRWVLEDRNAATGLHAGDRDHTDPVRLYNVSTTLLRQKIPQQRVTERLGFSNLVAWHLTGQGIGTQSLLQQRQTMFFDSGDQCVQVFRDADSGNSVLREEYLKNHPGTDEKKVEAAIKRVAGYVATHNANAYGEASNSLTLTPGRKDEPKYTIEEKFLPFFTDNVQDRYVEFLGPLHNQDPTTYVGPRHTWSETIAFIQSFQFFGMMNDGLTTLQLANNMALLGICKLPEADEMAAWIASKGELGAFKGLTHLGFNLRGSDPLATRAAFLCVYNHLNTHLSEDDKEKLGFGVIFCEHVLCKVQRWNFRYDNSWNGIATRFADLAAALFQNEATECLPFPLRMAVSEIEAIIAAAEVSIQT
ncbi:hypothetical protein R3P38DRAFT_2512186, partial [Favolaschia claudopus]